MLSRIAQLDQRTALPNQRLHSAEADVRPPRRKSGPSRRRRSSLLALRYSYQLVRAQQDRCRHIEAKRLGGRHIEHGLVFHRQLHRQIGRLLALKDAVDVGGGAA